jgi:cytochrome c biogenesis protein CcmG/thiol:disulfide interchange protein DsbE
MSDRRPGRTGRPLAAALISVALLVAACGHPVAQAQAGAAPLGLLVLPEMAGAAGRWPSGRTLNDGQLDLAQLRGRIVVLNAFASWCWPCQQELPSLVAASRSLTDVAFVGLDVNDSATAARGFLAAEGATYPVIADPQGALLARFTLSPTRGLPITFLIDQDGRVAGRILGQATVDLVEAAVDRLSRTGA